jgi:DNA-binding MarR family transcriptional regulator
MLFGDVLALARASWIREMAHRLDDVGFRNYRRSDALAVRLLQYGPLSFSTLTEALGVSRQSARKVIGGLVERDFATISIDVSDSRRRNVALTQRGRDYCEALLKVLLLLNEELTTIIDRDDLERARFVLASITDTFGL